MEEVGDGRYMIHARWRKIGSHVLTVFANDMEVCGSAIGVEVDAAPLAAARCYAKGDALAGLRAGEVVTCTVFTRDRQDNPCSSGGANVEVRVVDGPFCVNSVEDLGDGTYLVKLRCDRSGEYAAELLVNGTAIGDPIKLVVKAAEVDAAACSVSWDGLQNCVAGELRTVRVSTRDAFGNATASGCDRPVIRVDGSS